MSEKENRLNKHTDTLTLEDTEELNLFEEAEEFDLELEDEFHSVEPSESLSSKEEVKDSEPDGVGNREFHPVEPSRKIHEDWKNSTFIKVKNLLPNPLNPNEMEEETYQSLKEQLSKGELLTELIVTPSMIPGFYEVLDGNHKLAAAKELGLEELPCKIIDLPYDERLKFIIKLNTKGRISVEKTCGLLEHCKEKLNLTLPEIAEIFKPILGSYATKSHLAGILRGYSEIKRFLMKPSLIDKAKAKSILFSSFKTVEAAAYENPEDLVRKGEYRRIKQALKRKPRPMIWRVFTCPDCNTEWRISYNIKKREYYAWKKGEGREHYLRREKW